MKKFLFNTVLQLYSSISYRMVCLFILALFYSTLVFGESVWVSRLFKPFDGLAYQVVRDMVQTPDGSIWFATWGGGLSRFNGSKWETINEEKDLSDYMIRSLACDLQGGLWVGSIKGIKYYDGLQWKQYSTQTVPDLKMDSVFTILPRKNGEIWFGMDNGFLYSYNSLETASKEWTLVNNPEFFQNKAIRCLIELDDGSILAGGNRIYQFNGREWNDHSLGQDIRYLYKMKNGRIMAAGLKALFQFDGERWEIVEDAAVQPRSIFETHDSSIMVGTKMGVRLYQHNAWSDFKLSNDFAQPYVEMIRSFEDGSIWIGTRNGVYLVQRSDWAIFTPPPSEYIFKAKRFFSSPQISPRIITQKGEIISPIEDDWINLGTFKKNNDEIIEILHYDKDRLTIHTRNAFIEYTANDLSIIRSVPIPDSLNQLNGYQTVDGVFWLYGAEGLFYCTGLGWKPYERNNHQPNERVRLFKETRDGTRWIVFHDGIEVIGKEYPFLDIFKTPRNIGHAVTDICVDRDGSIWFGTSGLGIFVYDGMDFKNYNSRRELPSDWILCLYEDSGGAIWAGMDDSTVASFRDHRWITFSKKEIELESRITKITEDSSGAVWFVVEPAGLVRYTPSTYAPETMIDVFPKDIVPQGMGIFSFHGWDALHMTLPNELAFSWRILDHQSGNDIVPWSPYEKKNTVSSPPLNPGEYVFEVRAADKERNFDPTPASVRFFVEPYFYMKTGFWIPLLVLIILVLVSLLIVYRKHRALRESEKWLSHAQKIAHIGHWIADFSQNKLFGSDEAYRILGTARESVKGSYQSYLHFVHPEDRKYVQQTIRTALTEKQTFKFDHRIILAEGLLCTVQIQSNIVTNDSGQPIRMVGTIQDITDKRRAEEDAQRIQKLEAIRVLAGGIAHDFNNLLMAILGNISLVKRSLDPQSVAYKRLLVSEKASHKAHDLTMKLISFGEASKPIKKLCSLDTIVKRSSLLAINESNTRLEFDIQDHLDAVEVDDRQIDRVIKNVIDNASQSMPDGGLINICIKNIEIHDESMIDLSKGHYLVVTIEDHGCGIPSEHLSKIFDPYFTTRDNVTQKGMGLGLAISFSIIKQHKGHIIVESEPGIGSKFHIYLPAYEGHHANSDNID